MTGKTIYATRLPEGTIVEELSDGTLRPFPPRPPAPEMTWEEIEAAAYSDPDAIPMTREERKKARRRRFPRVKILRGAWMLEAEEFAARYHIPLNIIQDWEAYRSEPDQVAEVYLKVIRYDNDGIANALRAQTLIGEQSVETPALNGHQAYKEEVVETTASNGHQDPHSQALKFVSVNGSLAVESIREKLGLSAEEFAVRYRIPLDVLQDWEQKRAEPDPVACTYLELIALAPEVVDRALIKWAEDAEQARQELERLEREWAAEEEAKSARSHANPVIMH